MAPDVLLHLIEPGDWRAALADGAVRPPSLDAVGFVHLSDPGPGAPAGPGAVPGPARPGAARRRSGAADRPGALRGRAPADPGGMLFPHLYGPLPTSAVVAVVPYRPPVPPVLPAPDDRLGRTLALYDVPAGAARGRRRRRPGRCRGAGSRLHAHSRDNNRLLLTTPVDAATIEAAADDVAGNAGWPHRAAALLWPGADGVAAELGRRGWEAEELLLMARRRPARRRRRARRGASTSARCTTSGTGRGGATSPGRPPAGAGRGAAGRPRAPQRPGRRGDRRGGAGARAAWSPRASSAWTAPPRRWTRC